VYINISLQNTIQKHKPKKKPEKTTKRVWPRMSVVSSLSGSSRRREKGLGWIGFHRGRLWI